MGWTKINLEKIIFSKNDKSKQVNASEYLSNGAFPIIDQSDNFIAGYYEDEKKVIKNNLPLTVFGDHTRHVKFIDFPFVCGADGTQLMIPIGDIDDKYFYFLICNASFLIGNFGYDRHFKHLKDFKTPFTDDKLEQTKIASILSQADSAIGQTEKLIAKYQRIKTGLMQDLLTKGIYENGNIRNEKTHRFKTENGLRVPEEWSVRELGTLCEMKGRIGWQGYTINDLTDDASEPTVIGGTQISKEHRLDFSKPVYLKRQKYLEAPEIFVKQGNIVLVKTGNTIGKTALVDYEIGDATINPNTVILRDFKDITNRFLYLIMISDYFQRALWDFVFVGAQPSVNQTNMKTIKIPLAKDTEQEKISAAFFSLTNQIEAERTKLSKLQSLKSGIMQDLLSGKVRVKIKEETHANIL